jgi:hypothetical protein
LELKGEASAAGVEADLEGIELEKPEELKGVGENEDSADGLGAEGSPGAHDPSSPRSARQPSALRSATADL